MSISIVDFGAAIERLHSAWHQLKDETEWETVQILTAYGTSYLRVTRRLPTGEDEGRTRASSNFGADVEVDESDDEVLPLQQPSRSAESRVIYDIVHSTSYQVPVLYLTFKDFRKGARPSLEEIYGLLIPEALRTQVASFGVMGALSMTEHPIAGTPAYFIHPCRTQEAMAPLLVGRDVKPEVYLMLWLGVFGGSVGLHAPIELAQAIGGSTSSSHDGGLESSQNMVESLRGQ